MSFVAESSASGPQSGKAPYHSLTLPHLFYLYISGLRLLGSNTGLLRLWYWQSDALNQSARSHPLIGSVHFMEANIHVGFYELFTLW